MKARQPGHASRPIEGMRTSSATLIDVDRYVHEGGLLVGYGTDEGRPVRFRAHRFGEEGGRRWVEPYDLLEPVRLDPRRLVEGI